GASVDARADVYALGLVLWELLAGGPAVPALNGSLREVAGKLRAERLRPPPGAGGLRADISPAVASVLRKCLAPEPADRYASAADLREDLLRHLDNRPLRFAPEPLLREKVRKFARRRPRLVAGLVILAALAALAVVTAMLVLGMRRENRLRAERKRDEVD